MSDLNMKSARLAYRIARYPYAWSGGYPMFAITDDGAALCPDCCRSERRFIYTAYPNDGWNVVALGVNWENGDLYCDHCGQRIESAYAED